jgi:glycosyltransferase involved in cell wall biosynthesis
MLEVVKRQLEVQRLELRKPMEVEILTLSDNGQMTIGAKRNELMAMANGDYICFVDDDDEVAPNYIKVLMEGIKRDVDVVQLNGIITTNGTNPKRFEHSLKYNEYKTKPELYERYPNHLNCIKHELVNYIKFQDINMGEDTIWATTVKNLGVLKTEYSHDEILYYYKYFQRKRY